MKILFSITYYSPYVSGLTLYVSRMASALSKRGHQVSVLCFQHDAGAETVQTMDGVHVTRVRPWVRLSKGFLSPVFLVESWKKVQENDVVVVNVPQFEGFIPALFARLIGKNVVCVFHCDIRLPYTPYNYIVQKAINLTTGLSLLLCHKVITYTDDYAQSVPALQRVNKKLITFYPPVPKPRIDTIYRKKLQKRIGTGFVCIGIAARLAKEKGVEYAIGALDDIEKFLKKQVKLVIAGSMDPVGEKAYKKEIMDLVEQRKDSIVFLGNLAQDQIGAFYSFIDVLVLSSVNATEAFGMVQVESMLSGTPVVASNLPGVRVPVQKTGMGLISTISDSQSIASCIISIMKNRKKYIRPVQEIEREFSLRQTVDEFERTL